MSRALGAATAGLLLCGLGGCAVVDDSDPDFRSLRREAAAIPCVPGDPACLWRDSARLERVVEPALRRALREATEEFSCRFGLVGYQSFESTRGPEFLGFGCGKGTVRRVTGDGPVETCLPRLWRWQLRALGEERAPRSPHHLWYAFELADGEPRLRPWHGEVPTCPAGCTIGGESSLDLDETDSGPHVLLTRTVENQTLSRCAERPAPPEDSLPAPPPLDVAGVPRLLPETVVEIVDGRLVVRGALDLALIVSPKDGLPDFADSLWSGFTLKPLVETLRPRGENPHHRLRFRVPDTLAFLAMKPLLRSAVYSGFRKATLLTVDGPSCDIDLIDRFDMEQDPPIPRSEYAGQVGAELMNDSLRIEPDTWWDREEPRIPPRPTVLTGDRRDLPVLRAVLRQAIVGRPVFETLRLEPWPRVPYARIVEVCRDVKAAAPTGKVRVRSYL